MASISIICVGVIKLTGIESAYLNEISNHQILTREQEHDLAIRSLRGDKQARQTLIKLNLRLVAKLAYEHAQPEASLADLIQEGNLGLMHAITKFDPAKGYKLSTYARWWISAYMGKYIMQHRMIHVATSKTKRTMYFRLKKHCGDKSTFSEIAAELGVSEDEVGQLANAMTTHSLQMPLDGDMTLGDTMPIPDNELPDRIAESHELAEVVRRKIGQMELDRREKTLVKRRLLSEDPESLAEVAKRWNTSRERVRQVEERLKHRIALRLRFYRDAVAA